VLNTPHTRGFLHNLRFAFSVSGHFPHERRKPHNWDFMLASYLKHNSVTHTWFLKIPNHQGSTYSPIFLPWLMHESSWVCGDFFPVSLSLPSGKQS
jgi:hypothetical protein